MTDVWDDLAILRRCRRCLDWLPLKRFSGTGKLCFACVPTGGKAKPTVAHALIRGLAITPLGKADLARWRAEEAA